MRKFRNILIAAIMAVSLLGYSQIAHAWGTTGGDGSRFSQLQETAVFFNNSGSTLTVGMVVVLDTGGDGVATGTTLGSYVTLTGTGQPSAEAADSTKTIGVVKSTSVANQKPVVVVTRGPIDTLCADSGDAVTEGSSVGTSDVLTINGDGLCGDGTNLGVALEAGDGTDTGNIFVWVQGIGSE